MSDDVLAEQVDYYRGSHFHIVKNFVDPEQLTARLARLGWYADIRRDGSDWVYGEARPDVAGGT